MWECNASEVLMAHGSANALAVPEPKAARHHQSECVLGDGIGRWAARWKIHGEGSEHKARCGVRWDGVG